LEGYCLQIAYPDPRILAIDLPPGKHLRGDATTGARAHGIDSLTIYVGVAGELGSPARRVLKSEPTPKVQSGRVTMVAGAGGGG